jgi:hypothetical protein
MQVHWETKVKSLFLFVHHHAWAMLSRNFDAVLEATVEESTLETPARQKRSAYSGCFKFRSLVIMSAVVILSLHLHKIWTIFVDDGFFALQVEALDRQHSWTLTDWVPFVEASDNSENQHYSWMISKSLPTVQVAAESAYSTHDSIGIDLEGLVTTRYSPDIPALITWLASWVQVIVFC